MIHHILKYVKCKNVTKTEKALESSDNKCYNVSIKKSEVYYEL